MAPPEAIIPAGWNIHYPRNLFNLNFGKEH
jgi:hypothetical protein